MTRREQAQAQSQEQAQPVDQEQEAGQLVDANKAEKTEADLLNEKLRAVFDESVAKGEAEDVTKLSMISAGATFKNVTRLFNEFMVAGGHTASKEEREQVLLTAVDGKELATEDGFNAAVAALVSGLSGTSEKSASAMIRAHGKKVGIECFKRAKEAAQGKAGFASGFYEYLAANPLCTKEQAAAFINGTDGNAETSDNVKRHLSHYMGIWGLVNRIAVSSAGSNAKAEKEPVEA
jgi:regulator of replication initiation timing